ncbi:hypothetical protein [Nocardia transvalensis]|uniref:hypothetical protein n=1 Tax=Nocardia transvalensis TaxID=37333 RepID=UPI001894B660|nr:hypothetical protein [Nocardia transvalensis]MBF6334099.1 hypothetical protein [Nocardia transvalensis]
MEGYEEMRIRALALILLASSAMISGIVQPIASAQPADAGVGTHRLEDAIRDAGTDAPVRDTEFRTILIARAATEFAAKSRLRAGESFDVARSRVVKRKDGSFIVTARIDGATVGSSISQFFDTAARPQSTVQMSLHAADENSGTIEVDVDGVRAFDKFVEERDSTLRRVGVNWDGVNKCLSSAGVPTWVISAISAACAIGCAVSAGAGCVICASGAAGGWASEIAYCIKNSENF